MWYTDFCGSAYIVCNGNKEQETEKGSVWNI